MAPKQSSATVSPSSASTTPRKTATRRKSATSLKKKVVGANAPRRLSTARFTRYGAYAIAFVYLIFGLLDLINPRLGLTFFEIDYPLLAKQQTALETLLWVIGARDVFVGSAILIALRYASARAAGLVLLSAGGQALFDGLACAVKVGKGQWNHWGYAWLLLLDGALLVGVLDS